MANVLLRSPFYEYRTRALALSAKLELSINGNLEYTILKDTITNGALFEISELASDFLEITFNGTYSHQGVVISGVVTYYDGYNGAGNVLGLTESFSHIGLEGYSTFQEGKNSTVLDGVLMQPNTIVYVPENTSGQIPFMDSGEITYSIFGPTDTTAIVASENITIKRLCDPLFTPVKVTFVNKLGALQDLWFDKKSVNSYATTSESFRRNIIGLNGDYNTTRHQTYNTNFSATESITLNTGFVDEGIDAVINELILSTGIWGTINGAVIPLTIKTKSQTRKTQLNDKLINYTIDFDFAFDSLNNIR